MANVTFTFNPVPSPACYPPDINSLAQELTTGGILSGSIPDTAGGGITVGSTAPTNALINKVWLKTDTAGRPLGWYAFYNGNWRKVYTGVAIGELRMFWYPPSEFDGTGKGLLGGNWDGWAQCNGQNGTPTLNDSRFPVGGFWSGSAWVSWDTRNGAYQSSGGQGATGHKIDAANDLPPLHVVALGYQNQGMLTQGDPGAYVGWIHPDQHYATWHIQDNAGLEPGSAGQKALPLPNYFAMGLLMFIGY